MIGVITSVLCIIKISLTKKLSASIFEKIYKKFFVKKDLTDVNLIESVIDEKNFVLKEADETNSHIVVERLNKTYYSIFSEKEISAIKDINLSIRKNEVYFINILVCLFIRKKRRGKIYNI